MEGEMIPQTIRGKQVREIDSTSAAEVDTLTFNREKELLEEATILARISHFFEHDFPLLQFMLSVSALGASHDSQVWGDIGNRLLHFLQDGGARGVYFNAIHYEFRTDAGPVIKYRPHA
jgi:hypothetical protein